MRKIYTTLGLCMLLTIALPMAAKIKHLMPTPKIATASSGTFSLNRAVRLQDPTNTELLKNFFIINGQGHTTAGNAPQVNVTIMRSIEGAYNYELHGFENEAYELSISSNEISIKAVTKTGVIRATQTLMQLAEGHQGAIELENVYIKDWPAFKLRGYMHDVGRSFISVDEIKHQIDLLSHFKVNVFHFHLTENQAWRFEVKKYPQLTHAQHMTRFAGNFYTQEQCQEIESYAYERGMLVIPEIDMPGHSTAFTQAMGHNMQSDAGIGELQDILEEVASVFTHAPYIHIGADEQDITYPNFLKIITDKVHDLGKKVVVWNPIKNQTITTATGADMTQLWSTAGKAVKGIPSIDCRYNYTNHFDVFADLVGIYKSNIYYAEKGSSELAGEISAYWNDRKLPTQTDITRQNNFYANVIASAERAWKGGGRLYIEKGGTTLPNSGDEYEEFANWEERFLFHKANRLKDEPIPYVRQCQVQWRISDPFPNNGDPTAAFPPETSLGNQFLYNGKIYNTHLATGAGIYLNHTWGTTVPAFFNDPKINHTAYAWTYVYSPVEQTVGALIEFQNYGRSEKDKAPDQGAWDRKGSRIWLNNTELLPPQWTNSGKNITNHEVDLGNENFTARPPLEIKLNQGWNTVFIKLPYVKADGIRLNKWMFTFVITDKEGKNALENISYSADSGIDDFVVDLPQTTMVIPTTIEGNDFAQNTRWYNIMARNWKRTEFPVENPGTKDFIQLVQSEENLDDSRLWCFVGDSINGYRIYNKAEGTSKILVSPRIMSGADGQEAYPIMKAVNGLDTHIYEPLWLYEASTDIQKEGESSIYLEQYGSLYAVNTRFAPSDQNDFRIAFWTKGKGPASTLTLHTGISTFKIDMQNGMFTEKRGDGSSTFNTAWTSNITLPALALRHSHNNMKEAGTTDFLELYDATNGRYTLSTDEGYVITGYQLTFQSEKSMTVTASNGQAVSNSAGASATITVDGLTRQDTEFVLSGDGKIIVTDFYVTVQRDFRKESSEIVFKTQVTGVPYRIPALAKCANGDLIAIADYRYCKADIGNGAIDIHYRISHDNGKTWGEEKKLADGNDQLTGNNWKYAFGDACVVADQLSNDVLMLCVGGHVAFFNSTRANPQHIVRFRSSDNGATWDQGTCITEDIYSLYDNRTAGQPQGIFLTSGKILQSKQIKNGRYYRLYIAHPVRPGGVSVIYSDDFGDTWQVLGDINQLPSSTCDEAKCEELPDGSLLLSVRASGRRLFNVFTYTNELSAEGYWSTESAASAMQGVNACNGELLILPAIRTQDQQEVYIALQSIPQSGSRVNVGFYYKEILGRESYANGAAAAKDWQKGLQVSNTSSCYSTMQLLENKKIGFLFEENEKNNGYDIIFKQFSLAEITNNTYQYSEHSVPSIIETHNTGQEADHAIYDLTGRKVDRPTKGVYIKNGKKFIKK